MIFTECCYCDEPIIYGYEAGDRGAGGFVEVECEKCKESNFIELVSIGGQTMTKEYFLEKHPDAKKSE